MTARHIFLWMTQHSGPSCCVLGRCTHILVDDPALWPKGRRFTKAYYYIVMKNGERVNRSWLVYSESADRVFCFCYCLFGKQKQLSEEGFKDWNNLAMHLINHERSEEHRKNTDSWKQLSVGFQ